MSLFRYTKSESGVAALVGVSLTSLVIVMLTIGFTGAMTTAVRQATDSSSSVSSYYAAESGAAEAELYVIDQLGKPGPCGGYVCLSSLNQGCKPQANGGDPVYVAYGPLAVAGQSTISCRSIVANDTGNALYTADDTGTQFDLTGIGFNKIHLAWDSRNADLANNKFDGTAASAGPPEMELTLTTFLVANSSDPNSPSTVSETVSSNNIYQSRLILGPCGENNTSYIDGKGSAVCPYDTSKTVTTRVPFQYLDDFAPFDDPSQAQNNSPMQLVNCNSKRTAKTNDGGLICGVDITPIDKGNAPAGYHYERVLRVRTIAGAAQYHIQVFDTTLAGAAATTPIANAFRLSNAIVDVTAQVGNAYRRIVEYVPVRSGAYAAYNDALYADYNVCKDFYVSTTGASTYMGATPFTCTIDPSSPETP